MEIGFEARASTLVVTIAGSIDALNADELEQALESRIAAGDVRMIADLSGVTYTSSTGLRALMVAIKGCRSEGGDFRVAAANGNVAQVLELSGFTSILKVFDDVEQAVASFSE
jgi:anti-anti-sigma factor